MKKILFLSMLLLGCGLCMAQLQIPGTENYILNENPQQVLDTQGISDPLRNGAFGIINASSTDQLGGIVGVSTPITSHVSAQNQTLQIIKNILNYVLGLLGLVALIYLIYNGFLILTAAGDEAQYKKGLQSVKYAAIALAGIGASWLIVSLIFYGISFI